MIPREKRWALSPLAVGLLVHAPPRTAAAMAEVFTNAELVAQRNAADDTPAERAIHVAWITWAARHTNDAELAGWLEWAVSLIVEDWGLDAGADLAGHTPFSVVPLLDRSEAV